MIKILQLTIFLTLLCTFHFTLLLPSNLTRFAVLAGSTVTNSGSSMIYGDIGLYPGSSVTGFPPGLVVNAVQQVNNPLAVEAKTRLISFFTQLSLLNCITNFSINGNLGGMTLKSGVYCFTSTVDINGDLTLDAENKQAPYWIFQIPTAVTTSATSQILFINGSAPCNVFWNVGSSMTLGASSSFVGNINAYTSISLGTSATHQGRLLAQNGAVTLLSNIVTNCTELQGHSSKVSICREIICAI